MGNPSSVDRFESYLFWLFLSLCGVMVIITAFQAVDMGSIPITGFAKL